ncbi:MAG: hypothetical protein A3E25_20000 [Burkholderiales bacterium RIFCSPHIGHO2_12_FULL_69_20]|nr:MAG: hypothetical protein A3E25_20000 [Burkholderiales bacterium RIFCSPHIGHO2_12_FULL_69_20]
MPERFLVDGAFGFWAIARQQPDRPAVVTTDGQTLSFGALRARCDRLCGVLASRGLRAGDALALMLPNEHDWLVVALAAAQLGVYLVPMNWHLTADELAYLLRNSRARLFIAGARHAATARAAADAADLPAAARLGFGVGGFADLPALIAAEPDRPPPQRRAGGLLFYSSGTTGQPKGIRKRLPDAAPEAVLARVLPMYCDLYGLRAGDFTHLVATPLYHAAPGTRALQLLHLGHRVVLMDKWQPEAMLALIERYQVHSVQLVPILFHRLLALPEAVRQRYRHDSLACVIHAAAPCPVETKRRMIDWWGPVIHEYYAASEGGGTHVGSTDWLERPGTVGRPYPFAQVRILDDEGRDLPAGGVGLVYLRDGTDFEYVDDPVKTAAAKRDGFFTAGDFGYLDDQGWLYIRDRRTDLILSGGVNIYPAEVEGALMGHLGVADVAVFGVPDAEWGQRVQAVVEPVPGLIDLDGLRAELAALCTARLAGFKRPRHIAFGSLPRNDAGKMARARVREAFLAGQLGAPMAS